MESFLRVVGLSKDSDSLCEVPVKTSKKPTARRFDEIDLPDLAKIAAQTEQSVLQLEDEAKSLEKLLLIEVQDVLQRWNQALKRRTREETNEASFKAQFLRSNALEKTLEALRKNERLKQELADRPLFASADETNPSEVFMAELRSLLQLCLPKCAVPLVEPMLSAVFAEEPSSSETMAVLTALRSLKEDWREAVRIQTAKNLEMRLDSLTYKLQKMPSTSSRRFSRDRVHVLALLLQALVDLRSGMETHSAEIDSALLALGLKSPGSRTSRQTGSTRADTKSRSRTTSISENSEDSPSRQHCEAAMQAMAQKTEEGVRQGLRLLGLPSEPLHFVPGQELRLRGHDLRVAVCSLMTHWQQEEHGAFFEVLSRIQQILSADRALHSRTERREVPLPDDLAVLRQLRDSLTHERRAVVEKMQGLDQQLEAVEVKLRELEEERSNCSSSESVASIVQRVAEMLSGETQRGLERLGTQLQQRRTELISALRLHLDSESQRLSELAVAPGGGHLAMELAMEALQEAATENRLLCERVQKAVGGNNSGQPSELCSGSRCRARWMDGNYYDATIHAVLPGGFVVVNWLRPRPHGDTNDRPIRTISGIGGDDTLHRIIQTADVEFDALSPDLAAAFSTFRDRSQEDLRCVDCDCDGTEWASISFGTYLCAQCAEEHVRMGPARSLVRPLNDGFGWTETELKYMAVGGNAAFRACMNQHPAVQVLSTARRYETRFAEYYRRHLDALCVGAQLPPIPSAPEQSALEFSSRAEALALAQEAAQRIEEAAQAASSQCLGPGLRSCSLDHVRPALDPVIFEAPRSMSDVKSRRRKVSC